ncbi:conserved protein of unknown function [Candidatus Promineifilum breve]|uniref:ABM domain-containing protein n=1 Tax=Candidatus Promineifilum breve TaxID=1806508 RepID=A0A160T2T8_9CHLR|nr:hypothetical protein [Candidatus Promineifilum breve]CUS02885.2 conserved protein of unknown function [Candidatus Promineifilum breve]
MAHLLMQQEVADYEKWRAVFNSLEGLRRSVGARSEQIFRGADNPNAVTLLITWDHLDNARAWMGDPRLRAAMKDAGVIGQPAITYLDES